MHPSESHCGEQDELRQCKKEDVDEVKNHTLVQ